jgi:putative ABC transport system substrate-binding protein
MLEVFEVSRPADFEGVFQAMAKSQATGVLMLSSPLFADNPRLLADLALRNRLPAINAFPDFAQNGGLIGYGPDLQSLLKQTGLLTRKVLQGQACSEPQDGKRARSDAADIHSTQCRRGNRVSEA